MSSLSTITADRSPTRASHTTELREVVIGTLHLEG